MRRRLWTFSRSVGRRGRYLETVASETSKPSLASSPWIRGAPQPLLFAISQNSLRTSRSILGRPGGRFFLEIRVQSCRKRSLCHLTSVSGFTITRRSAHPGQACRRATQKPRSTASRSGRGRSPFNAVTCLRGAMFSGTRFARDLPSARTARATKMTMATKARGKVNMAPGSRTANPEIARPSRRLQAVELAGRRVMRRDSRRSSPTTTTPASFLRPTSARTDRGRGGLVAGTQLL